MRAAEQMLVELVMKLGIHAPHGLLGFVRALPPSLLDVFRRQAFRRTLRLAASRSPFYRQKFAVHGITIERVRRPEDLGEFSVTPEELRTTPLEALTCGRPELAIESSGTTGRITRILLSQKELTYNARQGIFLRALYGIEKDDRVICTLDYGFGLGGLLVGRGLPYWKAFHMCVGRVDPLEVYRRIREYRFTVVISDPFWLSRFTEIAEEEGRPYPLRLLIGGGEGITKETRAAIEAFWEAPLCMTYASTEAATILGFECLHREGYHLNEFDFYVEVLDPDAEGYGEVAITTVNRTVMPLIRYRTRDIARLIEEPCPCGFPFKRLSAIRGRCDELVPCVWGNVHPEFFEEVFSLIPGLTPDWQVALLQKGLKPTFQFRLELEGDGLSRDEICRQILKRVEAKSPTAWTTYLQKMVDLEFIFLPKGSLRAGGRKLLRLVDERNQRSVRREA